VLSICVGALAVANAGVLEGQTVTTHHFSMLIAESMHPEVRWVRGRRYVDSGQFISSAGVTSGVDATLYTLGRMFGRETADRTAQAMGYPHTRFLDDPTSNVGLRDDLSVWPSFYRWERSDIGLVLYDGVRELDVASAIDTYPRSLAASVRTLAPERSIIRSRHGLDLVPRNDFTTAPALDRVLVPGDGPAPEAETAVQAWAARHTGLAVERIHAAGGFPYDATLRDVARGQSNGVATAAANQLEYPTRDLQLDGPAWRLDLLIRPLALALLGLGAAIWLRRRPRPGFRSFGRFALHFAEMTIAMGAGMAVFHVIAGGHGHGAARPRLAARRRDGHRHARAGRGDRRAAGVRRLGDAALAPACCSACWPRCCSVESTTSESDRVCTGG
jgi:AraC family transcriptional activator FtrA